MPKKPVVTTTRERMIGSLLALPFLAAGVYMIGIGFHWLPINPAKVHAPGWVLAICGLVFLSGGFAFLDVIWRRSSKPSKVFGLVVLVGITMVTHWVAFGDGERHFTRTRTVNSFVVESEPVDEHSGRMAFGIGAVILDLALVALAAVSLRKRLLRPERSMTP